MNEYIWTNHKARLQLIKSRPGANFNWLFLPGGPGLGSESLQMLTSNLNVPGTIWHVDLPGDGSNNTPDDEMYFSRWSQALFEAVSALNNVILVAHSTGGMYVLSSPKLEKKIIGLVLMDSAPDASWLKEFTQYAMTHPIKQAQTLQALYVKKPSNALLKKLTIASASYSFNKTSLHKGVSILKTLPFNYKVCEWSAKHFDQKYKAKWVPKNMPTLILAGEKDQIIPLKFFIKSRKFRRKNIIFRSVKGAGHYPWVENMKQIDRIFHQYAQLLHGKR